MFQLKVNWEKLRRLLATKQNVWQFLQKEDECHHMTIYRHPQGRVKIAHYRNGFGEPDGLVHIELEKPDGYHETSRTMTPQETIAFGRELIRRAKLVEKQVHEWKTRSP